MSVVAEALRRVLAAFDRLEIRYAAGGSLASSSRGNYRMTNDADFLVEMSPDQVEEFVADLGRGFYADAETMRAAILAGRPCNLIDIVSGFKFDLFPAAQSAFHASELDRRTYEVIDFMGESVELAITTAEDILLAKLRWYRLGGESSEQQWRDLLGIVAIRGRRLDRKYLRHWAKDLGVEDLLDRLI